MSCTIAAAFYTTAKRTRRSVCARNRILPVSSSSARQQRGEQGDVITGLKSSWRIKRGGGTTMIAGRHRPDINEPTIPGLSSTRQSHLVKPIPYRGQGAGQVRYASGRSSSTGTRTYDGRIFALNKRKRENHCAPISSRRRGRKDCLPQSFLLAIPVRYRDDEIGVSLMDFRSDFFSLSSFKNVTHIR